MPNVSSKEILFWEKQQLSRGGDQQSLYFLLESVGGITRKDLNSLRINPKDNFFLKKKLDFLESVWEEHLSNGCPIQQLCGITYWRDLKLKVSNKVLIPRPETELIIEIVFRLFGKKSQKIYFAELGTGSGAISIALALAYPMWKGIATDIDHDALEIAIKNYQNSSGNGNLIFQCGYWWTPFESLEDKLDLVISNPPYIPEETYKKLPKEVKKFEPKIALLGGEDGLKHIKEIIQKAPLYLKEKGWIILENHYDQGEKVKQLLTKNRFTKVENVKDLSGIGRFTIGRYK